MALLDLPAELLTQILEELGGRELRRGVHVGSRRLTLSRYWYEAALPVYLSGLDVASVEVTGIHCLDLPYHLNYLGSRRLMYKNTRRLHVRLYGHWWDSTEIHCACDDHYRPRSPEEPPFAFEPFDTMDDPGSSAIRKWQTEILRHEALHPFFDDLASFSVLEDVTFEVLREAEAEQGPQWDYLNAETCQRLLTSLSLATNLDFLTLDTSGSSLLPYRHAHICSVLAEMIPKIRKVRLRMVSLCPALFDVDASSSTSKLGLESLVIKLNQPRYPGQQHHMTEECSHAGHYPRTMRLHDKMIRAAAQFGKELQGLQGQASTDHTARLELLRISYMPHTTPQVQTVDCLSMRRVYYCGQDNFSYWPDGSQKWLEDGRGKMKEAEEYRR
ncbi:hypothetical protein LTR95_006726 [Oleoguttula sp. CCFEE 5521]